MYADTGLAFRFMQGCSPETHQFEDLFKPFKLSDQTTSLVEACEYSFGEESDLFKAPDPIIIEEPMLAVDPLSQEIVELSDLGSLQGDHQLIEKAFYECEHEEDDLLVKSAVESPLLSDVLPDAKNVSLVAEMDSSGVVVSDAAVTKSVSSGNLRSMDMTQHHEDAVIQRFFFPPVDNVMRRAFSESDIQRLGTRNAGLVQSRLDRIIVSCTSEDRREKLSRYRDKKTRRNFGRKIKVKDLRVAYVWSPLNVTFCWKPSYELVLVYGLKYACRKTLADSQPRIRGRFAKNRGDAEMRIQ